MGLFLIQPPQEYAKKSTQGSMLRSIEFRSRDGSWGVADCWAFAKLSKEVRASTATLRRRIAIGQRLLEDFWDRTAKLESIGLFAALCFREAFESPDC